ncbi:MAG: hypothetical protein JWO78_303 [Micavibrio sp.]|nr:hypothetical protein [Micavibrio sp.]
MAVTYDALGNVTGTEDSAEEKRYGEVRTPEGQKKLYEQTKLYQQGKLNSSQIRDLQENFLSLGAKIATTTAKGAQEIKDIEVTGKKNEQTDMTANAYTKGYEESMKPQAAAKAAPAQAAPAKASPPKPTIPFRGEDLVMQAQLRMLGQTDVGDIDGRRGAKTDAAVAAFAKKNGLEKADDKAIRAKIAERFEASGMDAAKINSLVHSGDANDVKAGQIAYNLKNRDAMVKVTGVNDDATRAALVTMARGVAAAVPASTTPAAPAAAAQQAAVQAPEAAQAQQQQQQNTGGLQVDGGARVVPPVQQSPQATGRPVPAEESVSGQQPRAAQPPYGAAMQPYPQPIYNQGAIQMGNRNNLSPFFTGQAAGGAMAVDRATGIAYNPYTGAYMNPRTGHEIGVQDRNRDGVIDRREYGAAVARDNYESSGRGNNLMTQIFGGGAMRGGMQPVIAPWAQQMHREGRMDNNIIGQGVGMLSDRNRYNDGAGLGRVLMGVLNKMDF